MEKQIWLNCYHRAPGEFLIQSSGNVVGVAVPVNGLGFTF
jgi:hypothetical protein